MNQITKFFLSIFMSMVLSKTAFGIENYGNTDGEENNIILDGMIGPYDPNDPDREHDPNFSDISTEDIEGNIPDNYYTISVTVPTNMHFAVISGFGRGQFYSPTYTIENKATRPIHISVVGLEEEKFEKNDEFQKLYLRKPIPYDDNIEIELYLAMKNKQTLAMRKVLLSEEFNGDKQSHYLGLLAMKESAILQFESNNWDVPGLDAPNKYAKNDFQITLEFSLDAPIIIN